MRQTNGSASAEAKSLTWVTLSSLDSVVHEQIPRLKPLQWAAFKANMQAAKRAMTVGEIQTLAETSGITIPETLACALALWTHEQRATRIHIEVFHACSADPLLCREFSEGWQPTPWRCSLCGKLVRDPDEITYELRVICASVQLKETA